MENFKADLFYNKVYCSASAILYLVCLLLSRKQQKMRFIYRLQDLRLDVVGLLAILGEGSVMSTSYLISLSYWSYLPRLIPAPQALLPAQRKLNLVGEKAQVASVESGNNRSHIHHIANILLYILCRLLCIVRC